MTEQAGSSKYAIPKKPSIYVNEQYRNYREDSHDASSEEEYHAGCCCKPCWRHPTISNVILLSLGLLMFLGLFFSILYFKSPVDYDKPEFTAHRKVPDKKKNYRLRGYDYTYPVLEQVTLLTNLNYEENVSPKKDDE